ncbi:MAG: 8-hydroxy-5-deazaflavin:NADPH oxidoreductase [Mycobacterium sp.]|nr:8-hydroxy-5-deazaflavin:NADPH oxidoreductase [Mycobacterium sp.]
MIDDAADGADHAPVLAILGIGRVGSTLARRAIAVGYRVLVAGSGAPEQIGLLVEVMMPGAEPRWAADAADEADVVVLAAPFSRLHSLPLANLDGKIVVDVMNHWQPVDGDAVGIELVNSTSETVATAAPGARVVKSLNHIGYHEIEEDARPAGNTHRRAVAVASDHPEAAAVVLQLVERLGFDAVDAGPLANGLQLEPGNPLFGARLDRDSILSAFASEQNAA